MNLFGTKLTPSTESGGVACAENEAASKAKNVADPGCTVSKAAKGASMKATVGVGNRCGAAETARDVTGVDGKAKDAKKKVSN